MPMGIELRLALRLVLACEFPAPKPITTKVPSKPRAINSTLLSKETDSLKSWGPAGESLYTRAGNFGLNADGELVLGSAFNGFRTNPNINIPQEAIDVVVSSDGIISYRTQASTDLQQAGQLQISKFRNPDGLLKTGDNLFKVTAASGTATQSNPGQDGFGVIAQGFLEASNVEPVTELIDLITTQRAFELNSQVVQAGDQIMQIVANLRRG